MSLYNKLWILDVTQGSASENNPPPCAPGPTQPVLEPVALTGERTLPSAQNWEHGSLYLAVFKKERHSKTTSTVCVGDPAIPVSSQSPASKWVQGPRSSPLAI